LTSAKIGYAKNHKNNEHRYFHDKTNESANFKIYDTYLEKIFDTILIDVTDATSFSTNIFAISGQVKRIFDIETAYQMVKREIGDFIHVYVDRPAATMLGRVKAEVIGISKDLNNSKIQITCRFIELDP